MAGVNDNLIPPVKGEIRNPKGRTKGSKNLSTYIREMAEDETFTVYLQHPTKGYVEFKGMPVIAVVKAAWLRAAMGDKDAREWLAKYGYGTSIDVTSKGESIAPKVISEIKPRELNVKSQAETTSSHTTD